MERQIGRARARREDPPLVTGAAMYTDDIHVPDVAFAVMVRSQYAHATIEEIDTSAAEAKQGVFGVYTAADLAASDAPGKVTVSGSLPDVRGTDFPLLADAVARYSGEPVAVVVADDRYLAHDAADLVDVDYGRLDAVMAVDEATRPDAPTIHDHVPDNVALDWTFGDEAGVDRAFDDAEHVVGLDLSNQRLIPEAMEPRAALAEFDDETGRLTVRMSTQAPHRARARFAGTLGLDDVDVRVVAPAVGGGFGSKGGSPYSEEPLAAWCSTQLQRPVKWTARRTESHLADHHGRDFRADAEIAFDGDGTVTALRVDAEVNLGAYLVWGSTPAKNFRTLLSGQYAIPAIRGRVVGAFTNTAPIAPYRGAGRPEANFVVERLFDRAAVELGIDPVALRRRNQIPADAFPHETATGSVYDSGDYETAMDLALDAVDYDGFRARQAREREAGRNLGVGVANFVENTGTGPGRGETARVEFDGDGRVIAYCGTSDHGQGHETTFAQLVSDELGVAYEDVRVVEGDTDDLPDGTGTFGSRSAPVGGSALVECARQVREQARRLAADHLEAATADVTFSDGAFTVAGAPERSIDIQAVARLAAEADSLPPGVSPNLAATDEYVPDEYAFAFGTHVAIVEVDEESGAVAIERYVAVDDVGTQFNPKIVEGQVHGGVAQGVGQALTEEATYDDNGNLLSGSLQDYALPKAITVPEIETHETETPCPHNPTGAKGVGEGGAIGAPPAIVNAVVDALAPFGVANVDTPLSGERVWRAIEDADH